MSAPAGVPLLPGSRDRRNLLLPASIASGLVLAGAVWWAASPHGPRPRGLVFENPELGCRFEYPSSLTAGPNFVRAGTGSILTIERHPLLMAKKDWVAELPEVLFPQVMLQLEENYRDLEETGHSRVSVDGRPGVEVVLRGRLGEKAPPRLITILIVATDEWVYVVRSYSLEKFDAVERPLFRQVRETWKFLGQVRPGSPQTGN